VVAVSWRTMAADDGGRGQRAGGGGIYEM
jgi:hypothetical protein